VAGAQGGGEVTTSRGIRGTGGEIREVFKDRQEPWRDSAACKGVNPAVFFPEQGGSAERAMRFCWSCPVTEQCLEFALRAGFRDGVWGGMNPRQRRLIKRQRLVLERSA